jgi:DNA primase
VRARLAISEVIGRKIKLTRKGREHLGLCPFHSDRKPSLTVSDEKGFYHCFSCQAHGDVFAFVMETEGLSFPEALEQLAGLAGLEVPARTRDGAERAQRRASLVDVMEMAAGWYESQLAAQAGAAASAYLNERGVSPQTAGAFRLGFAPARRTALKDALIARGVAGDALIEAGLVIQPEVGDGRDGGDTYDRFRDRIMFPIADHGGKIIAFGGRAMGEAKAKYLNSPETPLFHKGSVLYGLAAARGPAREAGTVLVAEGYMDVIALHEAGFAHVVAPLGTALTEDQLALLWRVAPEPVLCFDGDAAGGRAAIAAAARALPLLQPGRSLRIAKFPEGEDPDSFVRKAGAGALRTLIGDAMRLDELLWWKERTAERTDSPEREAGLRARLDALAASIKEPTVREAYQRLFAARLIEAFGESLRRRRGGAEWTGRKTPLPPARPSRALLQTRLVSGADAGGARERFLLGCVLAHASLFERIEEPLAQAVLADPGLDRLRGAILKVCADQAGLDSDTLDSNLRQEGFGESLDRLAAGGSVIPPKSADLDTVERAWREALALHSRGLLQAEIETAWNDFAEDSSEEKRGRVRALQEELGGAEGVRTRGNLVNPV